MDEDVDVEFLAEEDQQVEEEVGGVGTRTQGTKSMRAKSRL